MKWNILDCTLRDGGYYTNWDFKPSLVQNYLQTMASLPIEYLEIGYRNPPDKGYFGEYYYLSNYTLKTLISDNISNLPKLAVMLDTKKCQPEDVPNLLGNTREIFDLVRIAVDPNNLSEGIALATSIKNCGFKVAVNLMYLSKIGNDYSFLFKFQELGEIVDYLYLVDSYGACLPKQVGEVVQFAKAHLPQKIGFHGHDNISLAFANSLAALDMGADIVDSTILGMGRGAGNLKTELIINYLNKYLEQSIDLSNLADLLEIFDTMKDFYRWGSDLPYVISGFGNLPQKEVMEWLGKKRYSTCAIVQTLQGKQRKTTERESYPQLANCLDFLKLKHKKVCVIVGGGKTAVEHNLAIKEFVRNHQAILIHSSLKNTASYTNIEIPQILCLPGREADKLKTLSHDNLNQQFVAYVLSSSPRMTSSIREELAEKTVEVAPIDEVNFNYQKSLIGNDSPLGLALGVAQSIGVEYIYITGFDGYPKGNEIEQELAREVQALLNFFRVSYPETPIQSLTPTRYSITQSSVYALLRLTTGENTRHELFV